MTEIDIHSDNYKHLAKVIRERHNNAALAIWENGRDLAEIRDELKPFGVWCKWQDEVLCLCRKTVNNYIAVFKAFPDCVMVTQHTGSISILYQASRTPDPVKEVEFQKIVEKAHSGEKMTDDDLSIGMDRHGVDEPAKRAAIRVVNEVSPQLARDMMITGAITNLDGDDVPIAEADETLFRVQADNERKERILRHVETELVKLQPVGYSRVGDVISVSFRADDVLHVTEWLARVPKASPMAVAS